MTPDLAIFLPSLAGGGAERVMLALLGEFTKRGLRCDLVVAASEGALMDAIPDGVKFVELHAGKPLRAVPKLACYVRRVSPRVLLSTIFNANVAALLAAKGAPRTRVVIREANPTDSDIRSNHQFKTWLNRSAASLLYPTAGGVIAISKGVEGVVRKYVRNAPLVTISNPLPFNRKALDNVPATKYSRPTILACGRLAPQKDYPTMLRAFSLVRAELDAQLVILGDGPLRRSLESLAVDLGLRDYVQFVGFVSDPYPFMKGADMFLHTATYEGFGVVLVEAMAAGLPVVATDCEGGVREVLAEGASGLLVEVGNTQEISNGIRAAMAGQTPRPGEHYLEKFDLAAVADRYVSFLFGSSQSEDRIMTSSSEGVH